MNATQLMKSTMSLTKDWRDRGQQALRQRSLENPVLQRVRDSLEGKAGLVITSYDKMHHRHNRS